MISGIASTEVNHCLNSLTLSVRLGAYLDVDRRGHDGWFQEHGCNPGMRSLSTVPKRPSYDQWLNGHRQTCRTTCNKGGRRVQSMIKGKKSITEKSRGVRSVFLVTKYCSAAHRLRCHIILEQESKVTQVFTDM